MAMGDENWTLSGLENLRLESESGAGKSMGRATPLTDAQLTNRRDQLVQFLEAAWGQIGYDLRRVRTPQGIPKVLARVEAGGYQPLLAPFVRASGAKPDAANIRAIRRQIGKLNEATYKAYEKHRRTAEALSQAAMAVNQCSKANLKTLKKELARCKRQAKRTNARYSTLNQEANALRADLESVEAAYAQSELLNMVRSKRYSYTPLNLADGMAGLPFMGWRQSASRCYREDMLQMKLYPEQRTQRCTFANGLWYTLFLMIQKVVEPQKSSPRIASELARAIARMGDPKKQYVKDFLVENWFFLKRVIQVEHKNSSYSKSLPYRIKAAFQKQVQSQSAEDRVLREMEKLDTKKPRT